MAEHQVMSCGNFHNIRVTSCYFNHNSYSRDLVSHPNGHDQRARPEMLVTSEASVGRAPLD